MGGTLFVFKLYQARSSRINTIWFILTQFPVSVSPNLKFWWECKWVSWKRCWRILVSVIPVAQVWTYLNKNVFHAVISRTAMCSFRATHTIFHSSTWPSIHSLSTLFLLQIPSLSQSRTQRDKQSSFTDNLELPLSSTQTTFDFGLCEEGRVRAESPGRTCWTWRIEPTTSALWCCSSNCYCYSSLSPLFKWSISINVSKYLCVKPHFF